MLLEIPRDGYFPYLFWQTDLKTKHEQDFHKYENSSISKQLF